jgi:sulfatase maturation enzyme AslB (radical SAM superfamily)
MDTEFSPDIAHKLSRKPHPCFAPYISLNFDAIGRMGACCYNKTHLLGTYPKNSIKDAWFGKQMQDLRSALQNLNFNKGCQICKKQLLTDNYNYSHLKDFDSKYNELGIKPFPQIITLEISNICNYECIMCGGFWSSSIRKNREKLSPIKTPYDDTFIEELAFFIEKSKKINFLGGEPFANPLYYKIWDLAPTINPNIIFCVTTNCSIYNPRIEEYLKTGRFKIVASIDSLIPETYNFIRKNGCFDRVMSNLNKFKEYNSLTCLTFCPMIQNWQEIPSIYNYCQTNRINTLYFNYVSGPLGGKIKNIHENGDQDYAKDWVENPKVNNKLENLIPEVCLYTLPKEERKKICTFLAQTYTTYPQYKYLTEPLIKSLEF